MSFEKQLTKWCFSEKMLESILWEKKSLGPMQAGGHCKESQSVLVYQQVEVKLQPCCLYAVERVNAHASRG